MRSSLVAAFVVGSVLGSSSACDFDAAYARYRLNAAAQADAGDVDAGVMCMPSVDPDACGRCVDEQCCGEYARCREDVRCGQFRNCSSACTGDGGTFDSCLIQCDATNGGGAASFAPYFACASNRCLAECKAPAQPTACELCTVMKCGVETRDCDADRHCRTLQACANQCTVGPFYDNCIAACKQARPAESVRRFNAKTVCVFTECGDVPLCG